MYKLQCIFYHWPFKVQDEPSVQGQSEEGEGKWVSGLLVGLVQGKRDNLDKLLAKQLSKRWHLGEYANHNVWKCQYHRCNKWYFKPYVPQSS